MIAIIIVVSSSEFRTDACKPVFLSIYSDILFTFRLLSNTVGGQQCPSYVTECFNRMIYEKFVLVIS